MPGFFFFWSNVKLTWLWERTSVATSLSTDWFFFYIQLEVEPQIWKILCSLALPHPLVLWILSLFLQVQLPSSCLPCLLTVGDWSPALWELLCPSGVSPTPGPLNHFLVSALAWAQTCALLQGLQWIRLLFFPCIFPQWNPGSIFKTLYCFNILSLFVPLA